MRFKFVVLNSVALQKPHCPKLEKLHAFSGNIFYLYCPIALVAGRM